MITKVLENIKIIHVIMILSDNGLEKHTILAIIGSV